MSRRTEISIILNRGLYILVFQEKCWWSDKVWEPLLYCVYVWIISVLCQVLKIKDGAQSRRFYCKVCGENFEFSALLRQHERQHEKESSFHCSCCGQVSAKLFICVNKVFLQNASQNILAGGAPIHDWLGLIKLSFTIKFIWNVKCLFYAKDLWNTCNKNRIKPWCNIMVFYCSLWPLFRVAVNKNAEY